MTTRTGPQIYPGASTAHWYQDDFGGSAMEVNVVVLHTTEGPTLPDYDGGAVAPTLTAVPDFATQTLRWFQHFGIDTSARALVNLSGGVETNTANVCQVELVGTCDPATHAKWNKSGTAHVYWPEAPEWALREVAAFLRWMNAEHGVPLTGPARWPAYPSSYASEAGQRMTFAQWTSFKGVCGHMHVPENVHGDPGALDFPALLALAKGVAPTTDEETDDMPSLLDEANATDYAFKDGVWTAVAFQTDGVLLTGPVVHDTLVTLYFDTATDPETKIQGQFFLTDLQGQNPSGYLVLDRRGGGGHQFALSGKVPAGKQLWFKVRTLSPGAVDVNLLHRTVTGPYWAAA